MLLFADIAYKQKALREKKDDKRYPHGIAILDSKRWLRALDRGDATDPLDHGTTSSQILRYLSSAEIASNRQIRVDRLLITLELIERERLAQPSRCSTCRPSLKPTDKTTTISSSAFACAVTGPQPA